MGPDRRLLRGIAARLAWMVILGGGVVMALVLVVADVLSERMLKEQVRGRTTALATATANEIETVIRGIERTADGLRLAVERVGEDGRQAEELVRSVVGSHGDVYGAAVAVGLDRGAMRAEHIPYAYRSDGRVRVSDLAAGGYEYASKEWFAGPLELERPLWTEPYLDVGGGGVLMTTYAVPLATADGEVRSVVTCDLALDWLSGLLETLPLGEEGYGLVVSAHGAFLAHPNHDLILKRDLQGLVGDDRARELRPIARRMVAGESGFVRFTSAWTGQPSWLAFVPVASTGWSLGVVLPVAVVDARQAELHRAMLAAGLAGFAGLTVVAILLARSITRPLRQLEQAVRRVATGDLDVPVPSLRGEDEVALLASAFATMQGDLKEHIARLEETTAARERIQRELQIARDIQRSLLPKRFPPFPERTELDLHGLLEPAREVGGDLYDFFFVDDDELCLLVGDVSGKGVPAALFMAVTRTLLSTLLHAGRSPAQVMTRVNEELARDNDACMFVTLFCASIDLASGRCRYVNAGHNPPLLRRSDGSVAELEATGDPLVGAMEGLSFAERSVVLEPGDHLLLFTDGVVEAMRADGVAFGLERTAEVLTAAADDGCRPMVEELRRAVERFVDGAEQSDDLTILALGLTPRGRSGPP